MTCFKKNITRIALPAIILLASGCGGSARKAINPMTGDVQIKVWRVLGLGDTVGFGDNVGCRLSDANVNQLIVSLQQHGSIFGNNTKFVWDNIIRDVFDQDLSGDVSFRTQDLNEWLSPVHDLWEDVQYDENFVNIYFVGNVQEFPVPPIGILGLTIGPETPGVFSQDNIPAHIYIADGGFTRSVGFETGFGPNNFKTYFVLEHEMAHYLGRFIGITFGTGPDARTYDLGEHVPQGSNNLLAVPILGVPAILKIPGQTTLQNTELHQIWNRVWNGLWNSP
jgi:hypothetical protein